MSTSNVKVTASAPKSFYDLTDENIKNLLTVTPLAIAIDATNWEYYNGGIWKCNPADDVNHAVLLVGYTADGKSWIVKNQWGADWGDNGYIYVSTEQGKNCKIGAAVHMLFGINLQYAILALVFLLAIIM